MTRLRTDPVEVRSERDVPAQFLWRGRLYLVREVLGRWTETGAWWRSDTVRALTSGDARAGRPSPGSTVSTVPVSTVPCEALGPHDVERQWWRVEAGSGRHAAMSAGTGVYDLCLDQAEGTWTLARVLD